MSILGGFVLYGSYSTASDNDGADPKINSFRALPNPVAHNTPFTIFWSLVNIPRIRITSNYGYDSGILIVSQNSSISFNSGLSLVASHVYTLSAYDNLENPIYVGGLPLTRQLLLEIT